MTSQGPGAKWKKEVIQVICQTTGRKLVERISGERCGFKKAMWVRVETGKDTVIFLYLFYIHASIQAFIRISYVFLN